MHHLILTLSCQHKINRLCSNLVENINNFQRINFPRYFRKSKRISKIETFIRQSKLGDWSVDVNMFLSRGGRGERVSESTRLIIQSWVVKVSNQFQGNREQSYFWREIKAGRWITISFTIGKNQTPSKK